ncbi:MAG: D-alanyl-D-alanine carboxypeptidase [Tenericutes bacterium]|nr:D-alanyl-D-alanine carboxypeptidase [Mycoplasmatota bacterium]
MKRIIVVIMLILVMPINVFGLSLSCRSCVLMDSDSGRVLYEKDKDNPRLIASITKIMTAILAIESDRLEEEVTVGEEVLTMYGSNIYIELGEKMKLLDMVYGLMLRSGNDAAIVIAYFIGGSEENFVKMMNDKAKEIGMTNTVFNNSHGLDEVTQNKSTAYDMALLSSYASHNETYMKIVGTKKYSVQTDKKSYLWYNRNKLLGSYPYATGGKTGYTPSAGRTLVTNASHNNLNLTAVTLNDGNEYISHETMYNYGFENYKNYVILDKNKFKVDNAYYPNQIYIKESFKYPLTEVEKENVKVLVKLTKLDKINNNDEVGIVIVKLAGQEIYSEKVYVRVNKEKKNFFQKIWSWLFD